MPERFTCRGVTQMSSPSLERALPKDEIVAVGLLTREEVRVLGGSLKHVFPVPDDGSFDELIRRLDRESDGSTHSPK